MKELILKLKDPGSALTHGIGMIAALIASVPLIGKAASDLTAEKTAAIAIFIISMILLYGASTLYHSLNISPRVNKALRKVDHMMIYVLIAGTYTPVCAIVLGDRSGWLLLLAIWSIAAAGILVAALWINCPRAFSSVIYILMGWLCLVQIGRILTALPEGAFAWLLAGGLLYTAGGVLYALKLPVFRRLPKNFGAHEIFHLFVMAGSLCHYVMMYAYVC